MKQLTGNIRSLAYPMVGIVLVSSLWVMAAEKAKSDQLDNDYVPALRIDAAPAAAAPAVVAACAPADARCRP